MANVDFTVANLTTAFEHDWRNSRAATEGNYVSRPMILDLYRQLERAHRGREVEAVMRYANELIDAHGVEALRQEGAYVDRYHFDIIATYVNMGDPYVLTLLYDSENHAFLLTSYGGFLEAWEAEHPPETTCSDCGIVIAGDQEGGICADCADSREEAAAPGEYGRQFDVWVAHQRRGDGPHLVKARWSGGEDAENPLATVELSVHLPVSFRGNVETNAIRLPTGILYEARGITWIDSGWRLVKDSIGRALVELDRFLEETA